MKRIIFMGIAIMAIFVSSCKKEEMQAPVTQKPTESPLVLVKANVEENGMIGDLYVNKYTKQEVFDIKFQLKTCEDCLQHQGWSGTYSEETLVGSMGNMKISKCEGSAYDCYVCGGRIYRKIHSRK